MPAAGTVEPGFEGVREAFAEAQAKDEGGAQLCVYRDGRKVVDLWAGRDKVNDRPYTENTLTVLMSCTKGAVATCANMLADRGLLDIDAPVSRYWPEFAQAGKEKVRVRHLLNHSVGLSGYDPAFGITARDMLDWDTATSALARMAPLWEPGTAYSYHAITYGFLVGEVIRRISGKSCGRFFADEIARPLGLELWIGLPADQEHRVAPHFAGAPQIKPEQWPAILQAAGIDLETGLTLTLLETFKVTDDAIFTVMNARPGHEAEVPAGNGIGNARSLAKMYAAIIGEVDGIRLLSAGAMERAREPQTASLAAPGDLGKLVRVEPQRLALGFELARAPEPMLGPGSFGHAGAGGRMGFAHPESGVAVAYVCNNMLWNALEPDARWVGWTKALREAVGV